jgi:hypothetical protein
LPFDSIECIVVVRQGLEKLSFINGVDFGCLTLADTQLLVCLLKSEDLTIAEDFSGLDDHKGNFFGGK